MSKRINTAVLPVAGLGTRFLPMTKSAPKEMLPIVDRPVIHYVVEEALSAGITHFVLVTSGSKRAIEDYFDTNFELEHRLLEQGKTELLTTVRNLIPQHVSFSYIRQPEPLGLGHAIACAEPVVGNQPFAVLLADDIIDTGTQSGCLSQLIAHYETTASSVLAIEEVPLEDTHRYGIVSFHENSTRIHHIVEKPRPEQTPSRWAVTGRYVLTPSIFRHLAKQERGASGEIQLTDAIAQLLQEEPVSAIPFQGCRFDCGSKEGFLQATLHYAMRDEHLRAKLRPYLLEALAL